jgi:hypothetical protein
LGLGEAPSCSGRAEEKESPKEIKKSHADRLRGKARKLLPLIMNLKGES